MLRITRPASSSYGMLTGSVISDLSLYKLNAPVYRSIYRLIYRLIYRGIYRGIHKRLAVYRQGD